jgi:drug/metabolite transporter (DMT)-like permease
MRSSMDPRVTGAFSCPVLPRPAFPFDEPGFAAWQTGPVSINGGLRESRAFARVAASVLKAAPAARRMAFALGAAVLGREGPMASIPPPLSTPPAPAEPPEPLAPVVRPSGTQPDDPIRGILLILLSTIFMSLGDAMSKQLIASLPVIEILWLRYVTFVVVMCGAAAWKGPPRWLATRRPLLQVVRGLGMTFSALLFVLALRYLGMAEATAMTFVSPIFVMAVSAPLLGERVGLRSWVAALIALGGVLVIIRPGSSAFDAAALLPLGTAAAWAVSLIATRLMSGTDHPLTTLAYSALVAFATTTLLLPFGWTTPTLGEAALALSLGVVYGGGHTILVLAYRHAAASLLAPFSYAQLVWSTILGFLLFGNVPDTWTYIGAGVIIGAGLYTAQRARRRHLAAVAARRREAP